MKFESCVYATAVESVFLSFFLSLFISFFSVCTEIPDISAFICGDIYKVKPEKSEPKKTVAR